MKYERKQIAEHRAPSTFNAWRNSWRATISRRVQLSTAHRSEYGEGGDTGNESTIFTCKINSKPTNRRCEKKRTSVCINSVGHGYTLACTTMQSPLQPYSAVFVCACGYGCQGTRACAKRDGDTARDEVNGTGRFGSDAKRKGTSSTSSTRSGLPSCRQPFIRLLYVVTLGSQPIVRMLVHTWHRKQSAAYRSHETHPSHEGERG